MPQPASAALPPRSRRWWFPDPRVNSEVALWMCLFFAIVAVPIVVAMVPVEGVTKPRGLWRDFASALGYVGVSMLGVLFALSARLPHATAQFGIDVVFHFHRWLALLAIAVLLAHVGIVLALGRPEDVPNFEALLERPTLLGGTVALLLFVVMVGWSLARKPLADRPGPKHWASEYDTWRRAHALLATLAYLLLLWHVVDRAPSLDTGWKKFFWFFYAVVGLALIVWIRLVRPTAPSNRRWRVEEVRQEAPKVWTIRLKLVSGLPLKFYAGQFVWLTMRANRYAMREHPFSIASAAHPAGKDTIELTISERGNFTETIGTLERGEIVLIDGPFGRFMTAKRPKADAYLLVASGIGIAPVMSMLRTAADAPPSQRKRHVLFYFTQQGRQILFRDELDRLARQMKASLQVEHVETDKSDKDFITAEFVQRHLPDRASVNYECFLCCRPDLAAQAERALQAAGISGSRIHQELFEWV